MNGEQERRTLSVNCGFACLLSDRQGVLDAYDQVAINCGSAVVSAEMNGKLLAKGGSINSGSLMVREIRGEIIQLDPGTEITGGTSLKDLFVIGKGDLLVQVGGLKAFGEAEGVIVTGTLFYPAGEDTAALIRVSGEKRAYPPAARVLLGDQTLESLIAGAGEDKLWWVSGRVTALGGEALEQARSRGLRIICASLFTYEGMDKTYGDLFQCPDRTLVPDGHEIAGSIGPGELPKHGHPPWKYTQICMT